VTEKQQLRRKIAQKRAALDPAWRAGASMRIVEKLQHMAAFTAASHLGLYMAIDGEPDLDSLFSICWAHGKRTSIPVYIEREKRYTMAEITDETKFKIGQYGIKEPLHPALVPIGAIDFMAVPGVAFDLSGNRLGRGGGYYDRILDEFCGTAAGVTFSFQIEPSIPTEIHDKPVNLIITELEIINVSNER